MGTWAQIAGPTRGSWGSGCVARCRNESRRTIASGPRAAREVCRYYRGERPSDPFLRTGTRVGTADWWPQLWQNRDLSLRRAKCLKTDKNAQGASEGESHEQEPHPTTKACREYQRLLEESESARGSCQRSRAQVCRSRLIGKEKGDELLRLQAKHARAYRVLQKHANACVECGSAPKVA